MKPQAHKIINCLRSVAFVSLSMTALRAAPLCGQEGDVATELNVDSVTADTASHASKLRKLQILNRVFQVCYGRGLRRDEVATLLGKTKYQIIKDLLTSAELQQIFAGRLAEYQGGPGRSSTALMKPAKAAQLMALAKPTAPLADVLSKINPKHHDGRNCSAKRKGKGQQATSDRAAGREETRCFAEWLIGRTAPSLSIEWLDGQGLDYATIDYARLLERISTSSL